VFKWRRGATATAETADDESVDVAERLNPYERYFNEAMAMAARFAEERERRERPVEPVVRLFRSRRAS
jgi:hypothetical protein